MIPVRCHYCSRFRPAWRVHRLGAAAQTICDSCLNNHYRALEVLSGTAISGCHACDASWEMLRDRAGADVRLYVVPRDGVLQVLCSTCVTAYLPKRADLYKGTAFGAETLRV